MGSEVVSNIQEQKSTDKFCPVPWYHIVIDTNGSIRPCCRYAQPGNRPDGYVSQIDHPMPNIKDGQIDDSENFVELLLMVSSLLSVISAGQKSNLT
jgi:hypothetical protein